MAPDDVVLKILQVLVIHPPLRHRAEARVDAIDHLLGGELFQKLIASLDLRHRKIIQNDLLIIEYHFFSPI